jgi:large subunit ribosomal protein L25
MSNLVLNVKKRDTGKKALSKIRSTDNIPGVFYGKNNEPVSITANVLDLRTIVYTDQTKVFNLNLDGDSTQISCVLKDIMIHPVTDKIVHFDLLALTPGRKIIVQTPLKLVGTAPGVKNGGILSQVIRKVKLKSTPENLPEFIEVNISKLEIGNNVNLDSLRSDKFEIMLKENPVVCTVLAPRVKKTEETTGKKK